MTIKAHSSLSSQDLAEIRERLKDLSSHGSLIHETKDQSIYRFQAASRELIGKIYRLNSFAQKVAAAFNYSRAHRAYRAGTQFHDAGINTPIPLLLVDKSSEHILVTEFCPFPALLESIHKGEPIPPSTPEKILALLHQLSKTNCSHGDFHARNLLVDEEGSPNLIDLDGVRMHLTASGLTRYICNDRDRFLRSLEPLPEHHQKFSSVLGDPGTSLPNAL